MNFGRTDANTIGNVTTTSDLQVNCSGTPGRNVYFCAYIGRLVADRYLSFGTNTMPFQIYQDAAMSLPWTPQSWRPPRPAAISLTLGANGTASTKIPAYGVISAYSGKPAGPYFTSVPIVFGQAYDATSCSQLSFSTTAAFGNAAISLYQQPSCEVSVNPLNFGTVSLFQQAITQTSTIELNCTPGLPVAVKLGLGQSGATSPTQRAMQNGGHKLYYGLYKDAAFTQAWGDSDLNDYDISQTSSSVMSLTVYGKVDPQNPAVGNYSDQVVVSVVY